MCKVSVIIPVYNAEKYLSHCIKSILRQSYQDYELILVDDGSTDSSARICDRYAEKYSCIKPIHTKNQGPAAARRTGVGQAVGEYVTFVDADDWLDREMLAFAVRQVEKWSADILCLRLKEVDEKGIAKAGMSHHIEEIVMTQTAEMMYHLHGTRYINSGPCAKLIRRSLFAGIDYCEKVTIGEDYFMILQLLERAGRTVFCDKRMYNRCIRTTSISRSGYTKRHKAAFGQYMKWRMYLLDKYPELEREIIGYHTEYEMAVITAMCRNKRYDKAVIKKLEQDLRKNWRIILRCKETPLYMRISAMMIACCYPAFIIIFRLVHVLTGR